MIPEDFAINPQRYDLWQAYTFLAGQAENGKKFDWRFGFPASLSFPATEVEGIDFGGNPDGGNDLRLDVNLADSPLPLHLVETIIQERHEGNRAAQDFFDLLQNRLMLLWMEDAETMCPELGRGGDGGEDEPARPEERPVRPGWLDLPERFRTRLGEVNTRLGRDAVTGRSVFDSQTFGELENARPY